MSYKTFLNTFTNYAKAIFLSSDNKCNIPYLTMIITNCAIGTGLVSLPSATEKSGFALSIFLLLLSAVISAHTSLLIVISANALNVTSYSDLVDKSFGAVGKFILNVCNIAFPSFVVIAYGIAICDILETVFKSIAPNSQFLANRAILLTLSIVFFLLWASLPKHLAFLEKISFLSILFVCFYTVVFVYKAPENMKSILVLNEFWNLSSLKFIQSLSVFIFAFSIHHNVIHFSKTLRDFTFKRFCISLFTSFGLTTLIYLICILFGFLSFSGTISSNIFNTYCPKDKMMLVTRLIFFFTVLATYPLQLISIRHSVMEIIGRFVGQTKLVRYIVTVGLISTFSAVTIPLKDIKIVIEVGGALTAAPIIMIFPPLIYMKMVTKNFYPNNIDTVISWVITVFGFIITILGPILSIYSEFHLSNVVQFDYWCY